MPPETERLRQTLARLRDLASAPGYRKGVPLNPRGHTHLFTYREANRRAYAREQQMRAVERLCAWLEREREGAPCPTGCEVLRRLPRALYAVSAGEIVAKRQEDGSYGFEHECPSFDLRGLLYAGLVRAVGDAMAARWGKDHVFDTVASLFNYPFAKRHFGLYR